MATFVVTENYSAAMEKIEDHIFSVTGSLEQVSNFFDEHDRVLTFIEQNHKTPAVHPVTGDQSWVFGEGRYRLFFKAIERGDNLVVYLIHLMDNREANLDIYPANKIPTYDEN